MSRFSRRLQQGSHTTTTPPSPNDMPVGDLPGWTQILAEDFNTPAALGQVGNVYGASMRGYDGFTDTSGNGTYSADSVLSVSNSVLDYYLHTVNGVHMIAAPVLMDYNGQTYGRYSIRFRADSLPGYKVAFLLWPSSDNWNEGEVDFPEGDLDGTIGAFSHAVGNPSANAFAAGTGVTFTNWHIATVEWEPSGVKFYLDGTSLGTATGAGVPTTDFRWTLQAETSLSGTAPADNVAGHVQVDWAVAYEYNGGTPYVPNAKAATLVDSFTSQDTTKWSTYGSEVVASGGQVAIQASDGYPSLRSTALYDLTSSAVYAKVIAPTGSDGSIQASMTVGASDNDKLEFFYQTGSLTLRETVNGTNSDTVLSPYSSATYQWWRIREASGTVYWDTSTDGSTWTNRRSKTTTLDLTAVSISFTAGNWNSTVSPGALIVQSINTLS